MPDFNEFISNNIKSRWTISELHGDASSREYYRIFTEAQNYILCSDNNFINSDISGYPALIVYNLLKKNSLKIPEILSHDNKKGLFLLEDLGDISLKKYLETNRDSVIERYLNAIELLVQIQSIKSDNSLPFQISFDEGKLNYEFDFFIEHGVVEYCNISDIKKIELLREEFYKISKILFKPASFVLNHRDYHSRNIMVRDNNLFIIDYQDARMGLPQYDLVSLLRDSYFLLSDTELECLKKHYYNISIERKIHNMSSDEFDYYFDIMAFQRNVKAMGSFTFLVKSKQKLKFDNSIKPTLNYLKDYADRRVELRKAFLMIDDIFRRII